MPKYVDETPWAGVWPWSKRCKARLTKDQDAEFFGRCELAPHGPEMMHCLERGMIWVRWEDGGVIWTGPDYKIIYPEIDDEENPVEYEAFVRERYGRWTPPEKNDDKNFNMGELD